MVTDDKMDKAGFTSRKEMVLNLITAISLTDQVLWEWTPGFDGEVVEVRCWNRAKAGTVTVKLRTGGASFAAGRTAMTDLVPTTAAEDACVLSTTVANRRFTRAEKLRVGLTTDGSGALTNGILTIVVRPRPLQGEYL